MQSEKYTTILSMPNIDNATVIEARSIFFSYLKSGIIRGGNFDNNIWMLTDEYSNVSLDFCLTESQFLEYKSFLKIDLREFADYLKTFIIFQLGNLSLLSLQQTINCVKLIVSNPLNRLDSLIDERHMPLINKVSDFFSMLPIENREMEIEYMLDRLEVIEDKSCFLQGYGQRKLASFDSYFLFSDIIDMFWNDSEDENEKLFFFPVYLWWKITGVVPVRPREFILTPRTCLFKSGDEWILSLRQNRIKGSRKTISYKINDDYRIVKYPIPSDLANAIGWYLNTTDGFVENELGTLFKTESHYMMWERRPPVNSRYFTYMNLSTCLRYFFDKIIKERYGVSAKPTCLQAAP